MLFGDLSVPDKPGVLDEQLKRRGWNLTPEALASVRSNVLRRYMQTGNPDAAVHATLELIRLRMDAQQAIANGADRSAVEARFRKLTRQAL